MSGRKVYLSWGGSVVALRGDRPGDTGLFVSGDGIEGWEGAPDAKVEMTEMQTGDGAHAVAESDILYSARTVTINFTAHGQTRSEVLALLRSVSAACHHLVTLRVEDADSDTYATGYVQPGVDATWYREWATGTITVVCADPRRYSTQGHAAQMLPAGSGSGGLLYSQPDGWGAEPLWPSDSTWPGDAYPSLLWSGALYYPLNYGASDESLQNIVTVSNGGTSPCYPAITVNGPMDGGFSIEWSGGRVTYTEDVAGVPLDLDSLTRTASVGGLDTSRYLSERAFPVIQPGASETIALRGTGSGWATVEWRDTYI